ncbi:MAG: RNB domain-containing ribonuclease, partial [Bacteroidota bacterium]
LRQFLQSMELTLPPGDRLHPRDFAALLAQVKEKPEERLVHETVLRSQSQAAYAPDNLGHFGLALARYAHFTSPIRRYADLLVHRALIRGLKLGSDGLAEVEAARFLEIQIIQAPGHSPGSLCFYIPELSSVISGDVLFEGSIGRTDLPGGDYSTLINSIHHVLMPLPGHTTVYSGHGAATSIAQERDNNPFLRVH